MQSLRALQGSARTLTVLAAVLATPRAADAQEASEPVSLEYHAPATCPDGAEFVRRVREKTTKFHPVGPELGMRLFVVMIEGAAPSRGQLAIKGGKNPQAERSVEGDTCDEVVSALALATALAVDPRSGMGSSSDALPPLPAPEVVREEPKQGKTCVPERAPAPRAPSAPPRPSWGLGVYGLAAFDVAPNPLIGPGLWLEFKSRPDHPATVYQLAIEQAWSKEASKSEVPIDFSRTLLRLGVCPFVRTFGPAEAIVCGQATAGVLRASTRGVPGATDDTRFWGAAGGSLQLRFALGRSFGFMLGGGFDVSFERDWYVYQPGIELHRVSPVSGFGTAGIFRSLQ